MEHNSININGKLIDLNVPRVMGVINMTPDSFYKGSRHENPESVLSVVSGMIEDGADFIDIGGCSTRPGSASPGPEEEKRRVLPAIKKITSEFPRAIVSVDTFRAAVARDALCDCGAHMINDVSGGEADPGMFSLVRELNVPYILMHMQGTPGTMQDHPEYDDIVADILQYFGRKIVDLHSGGVRDIILDPGFGFGKTADHNFELLRRFRELKVSGLPLMAGLSRKSMVWKTLGITPDQALPGTVVLNTVALLNGANILRVHDVKEARQAINLVERIKAGSSDHMFID